MPMVRLDNWTKGSNNIAHPSRLPQEFARKLLNMDVIPGGILTLRPSSVLEVETNNARAMCAIGQQLVYVDGADVCVLNTADGSTRVLHTMQSMAPVAMTEFLGKVLIKCGSEGYQYDGSTLLPWGNDVPVTTIQIVPGNLQPGIYRVGATVLDLNNHESGCDPVTVQVEAGQAIQIGTTSAGSFRFYASPANGKTLHFQGVGSSLILNYVRGDTERLSTQNCTAMPEVSMLESSDTNVVGSLGHLLYVTSPMQYHLVNRVVGYISYAHDIAVIAPVNGGGVFVATEHETFFVSGAGTDQVAQEKVADFGAVPGTAVRLPSGDAAWFSRYGQVIGSAGGTITTPNKDTFAPNIGDAGSAGVLESSGRQAVVTSMRGHATFGGMAVQDQWTIGVRQ